MDGWMDGHTDGWTHRHTDGQTDGRTHRHPDLLHDEPRQHVHDEAAQARVGGQGLDDGAHQQHRERILIQQLLRHHRQHLRGVNVALRKAQVGGWGGDRGGRGGDDGAPWGQTEGDNGTPWGQWGGVGDTLMVTM